MGGGCGGAAFTPVAAPRSVRSRTRAQHALLPAVSCSVRPVACHVSGGPGSGLGTGSGPGGIGDGEGSGGPGCGGGGVGWGPGPGGWGVGSGPGPGGGGGGVGCGPGPGVGTGSGCGWGSGSGPGVGPGVGPGGTGSGYGFVMTAVLRPVGRHRLWTCPPPTRGSPPHSLLCGNTLGPGGAGRAGTGSGGAPGTPRRRPKSGRQGHPTTAAGRRPAPAGGRSLPTRALLPPPPRPVPAQGWPVRGRWPRPTPGRAPSRPGPGRWRRRR